MPAAVQVVHVGAGRQAAARNPRVEIPRVLHVLGGGQDDLTAGG